MEQVSLKASEINQRNMEDIIAKLHDCNNKKKKSQTKIQRHKNQVLFLMQDNFTKEKNDSCCI